MSRRVPKINTIKPYSKDTFDSCVEKIKTGRITCYLASKRYGIPVSTLRYRLSGRCKHSSTPGPSTVLTAQEEQGIVDWLLDMQSRGFYMTRSECIAKVAHYMMSIGRGTAFKNSQPGRRWCDLFQRRNPTYIPSKLTTTLSADNIRNWHQAVKAWFIQTGNLELLKDPSRIYLLEEISLNLPSESGANSSSADTPRVIPVMFAFGASGTTVPPNIIVPADLAPQDMKMDNLPPEWGMEICEQGFMNTQNFRNYITNVFHPYLVKQGISLPVAFFVDGQALPRVAEVEELCQSLGILLISSYRLTSKTETQPTDLSMAYMMKAKWQKTLKSWKLKNPETMHTLPYFVSILQNTLVRGVKESDIHNVFWSSGLYPFNFETIDCSELPIQTPEVIRQLDEAESNDPLDAPAHSEPELETESTSERVTISIDKIYEAYDLIDSHTRRRIQGDIRSLTREERIIRFFYREFIQSNVHFNDELSEDCALKDGPQLEEIPAVKIETPDSYCEVDESETMAELVERTDEVIPENQSNLTENNESPSQHVGNLCRMCGIMHQEQRYKLSELQNDPQARALLKVCFTVPQGLGSEDLLCAGCYQQIDTFRAYVQKCHESQQRLKWRCERCNNRYNTKHDLHQHIVHDHGEVSYNCEICGTVLKTKMSLSQHRRLLHNAVNKCTFCPKRFATEKMFEKHIQWHLSDAAGKVAAGGQYQPATEGTSYQASKVNHNLYGKLLGDPSINLHLPDTIKFEVEQCEYDEEGDFGETME